MQLHRTQIYLEPSQHEALKREARSTDISLAQLLRGIVSEHLSNSRSASKFTKDEYMSIANLGQSRRGDVSVKHDEHLGEVLSNEHSR